MKSNDGAAPTTTGTAPTTTLAAPTITLATLGLFWLPLALMWLLMGIEQPALNGVMARLPRATLSLAAFEVAFGIALVIESPILQILSAATALVRGPRSYRQMLRFMHILAAVLTTIHFVLSRPAVFVVIADGILGVPAHVVEPAREAFTWMIPFAALVGYRRLWQGSLIQLGNTGVVAHTMVIRLVTTLLGLALGVVLVRVTGMIITGSTVAGWSLIAGVFAGAVSSWWFYYRAPERLVSAADDQPRTSKDLLKFYVPLSLTSIMALVSRPILAFGISRSVAPLESLATWPVINSLLFLFTSIALSYQEAVVAKINESDANVRVLRRFGLILTGVLTAMFLAISVSGGTTLWFRGVAGLSPELVALARPAMVILIVMPIAVTGRSYFSGVLVASEKTGFLSIAVLANTVVLLSSVILLPKLTDMVGTVVAAIAFGGANVVQLIILWYGNRVAGIRDATRRQRDEVLP